jgi:hypothetical protein
MTTLHTALGPRLITSYAIQGAGRLEVLTLDISDPQGEVAPATDDYDLQVDETFGIEIVDVVVIKNGAGAGNTLQVKNGANAITDAIVAAVDKAVTRAGTIDRAQSTIAAGGTLRFTVSRAAGTGAMKVLVYLLIKSIAAPQAVAP